MLKYIITWVVVSMQTTSCPDANKANEFGVKRNPYTSCAVGHFRTVETPQSRTFTSRDSAMAFYNRAKALQSVAYGFGPETLQKLKIDSTTVK